MGDAYQRSGQLSARHALPENRRGVYTGIFRGIPHERGGAVIGRLSLRGAFTKSAADFKTPKGRGEKKKCNLGQ